MFVSSRDQGRRRRSHVHGISKAARSSKLSLLSSITTGSSGSSGSTSTVTQESYTRSRNEGSRRKRSKRRRNTEGTRPSQLSIMDKAREDDMLSDDKVDVFQFLVKEEGEHDQKSDLYNTDETTPAIHNSVEDFEHDFTSGSFHSDSGISLGEGSINLTRVNTKAEDGLPTLKEISEEGHNATALLENESDYSPRTNWKWPKVPTATHTYEAFVSDTHSEHTSPRIPSTGLSQYKHQDSICAESEPEHQISGYDLLAVKLASSQGDRLPSIFRRFRKTNYRMLLQMQDEIIEMEDELANLDTADTWIRHNPDGSTAPASRRLSWQWTQSDLQSRRLDILGRLYIKLEQYYQALASSKRVHQITTTAKPTDIQVFRNWLKENNPLTAPESHFLDDADDLICLYEVDLPYGTRESAYLLPIIISITTFIPLLFFKMTLNILNRLIFTALTVAVMAFVSEKLDSLDRKELRKCLLICAGISVMTAVLF